MRYVTSIERMGFENGMQQGIQQGIQQGKQQGMQQGLHQGKALLIQQLLAVKFANADVSQFEQLLLSATDQALDRFAMRLLVADTIEEVFSTQQ